MYKIAILVPLCSRNQDWITINDCDFFKILLPSLNNTIEKNRYKYSFYIGIDDNDDFFLKNMEELEFKLSYKDKIIILEDCNHNPAKAWNILYKQAYKDGYDYFYQIGSDVKLVSPLWTTYFIDILKKHNNIGICGGVEQKYWLERTLINKIGIIENAFFSRKHYEIFSTLFNTNFKNWFIDDHITRSYGKYAFICPNILYVNQNRILVSNKNNNKRYIIDINAKDILMKNVSEWVNILKHNGIDVGPVFTD